MTPVALGSCSVKAGRRPDQLAQGVAVGGMDRVRGEGRGPAA
jgi:hypothetical protein